MLISSVYVGLGERGENADVGQLFALADGAGAAKNRSAGRA
jgi:hypothetical protein